MNDLTGKFLPFQESEEIFAEGGGIDMKWTEPVRQGRVEGYVVRSKCTLIRTGGLAPGKEITD